MEIQGKGDIIEYMSVIITLSTRIGQKSMAVAKSQADIKYKQERIGVMQSKLDVAKAGMEQQQAEVTFMTELKAEAEGLLAKRAELQEYTDGLLAKFNAIPWSPDQPFTDKIESTDYQEKVDERHAINARLAEIETLANKTYFRR